MSILQTELYSVLSAAILGGSFVGMTEVHRLKGKSLVFASFLYSLFFFFILPFNRGFGGALGLAALLSCLSAYYLKGRFFSN